MCVCSYQNMQISECLWYFCDHVYLISFHSSSNALLNFLCVWNWPLSYHQVNQSNCSTKDITRHLISKDVFWGLVFWFHNKKRQRNKYQAQLSTCHRFWAMVCWYRVLKEFKVCWMQKNAEQTNPFLSKHIQVANLITTTGYRGKSREDAVRPGFCTLSLLVLMIII